MAFIHSISIQLYLWGSKCFVTHLNFATVFVDTIVVAGAAAAAAVVVVLICVVFCLFIMDSLSI